MARDFDGTDDDLTVASAPSTSTGDLTIGIWFYLDAGINFRSLVCLGGNEGANVAVLLIGNNKFGGFVGGSGGSANFESTTNGTPATGAWNLVALRVSSGTCQIVNHGVDATTTGTVTSRNAPSARFVVGSRRNTDGTGGTQHFDGRLSHVAIWERAVSTTELLDMATNLKSPLHYQTNLVYYNRIAGSTSPETPHTGTGDLTVTGTTQIAGPALTDVADFVTLIGGVDRSSRVLIGV